MIPGHEARPGQTEIWLKTNRRALLMALLVVLLLAATGASALLMAADSRFATALRISGGLTLAACTYFALSLLYQISLPRLAYRDGELWVYLQSAQPARVPIEIVELFFAGQGTSHLPAAEAEASKSRTVVVRLAEGATDWHFREVKPAWGEWREGYIIVRGTWCEPLTVEVMKRLNRRLREVHRARASERCGDFRMTRLLISVRDAEEACAALVGGANLIDIKEPARGALGAADARVWRAVLETVAGRVPVSAALGELRDLAGPTNAANMSGLSFVKAGLAGYRDVPHWPDHLRALRNALPTTTQLVAVAYADADLAHAPSPTLVQAAARELELPVLLIDTFDKTHGDLWSALSAVELASLMGIAHDSGMQVALAGSLTAQTIPRALELACDWIAVRGAACEQGRLGRVAAQQVQAIRALMETRSVSKNES